MIVSLRIERSRFGLSLIAIKQNEWAAEASGIDTWRWKMKPSALADKLRQEGKLTVSPAGEGKVRRSAELVNEAKVFAVGGLIESSAEKELRSGWDKSAVFMNKWIADGKAK